MKRRKFLQHSSTLLGAIPLIGINQFNLFNNGFFLDEEIVKLKIGEFNCTIFRDMMFKYLAKDFFINAGTDELNESLKKYHIVPDNMPAPFIAVLLQQDNRKILIDSGIGYFEKPVQLDGNPILFKGRLQMLLQQENIKKEDITDVIITHLHLDHIGGIFNDNGQCNFPNAKFYVHEDEWNYWYSAQADNQPHIFKFFIEKNITPLKNFHLNIVKGDFIDLLPGITAVKAGGHTQGQMALIIQSEKEHLLYMADTFLHPLHIEKLDWETSYDQDHVNAKQSRIKLLDLAYKENMLVNSFHFDFPGLGRIDKSENKWAWNYTKK